jgi:hypothetical protein
VLWCPLLALEGGCAGRSHPAAPGDAGAPGTALRGSCKGRLTHEGGAVRFEAAVAVKAPGRIYMEVSGPVGGTRAILAVSGDRLVVLIPPRRQFLEEKATPATYERLLGLKLTTATLLDLIGSATRDGTRRLQASPADDDGGPALLVTTEGARVRAVPDPSAAGGFESLELRVREMQSVRPEELPDTLFEIAIPEGWTRIAPAGGEAGGPLLFAPL